MLRGSSQIISSESLSLKKRRSRMTPFGCRRENICEQMICSQETLSLGKEALALCSSDGRDDVALSDVRDVTENTRSTSESATARNNDSAGRLLGAEEVLAEAP